MNLAGRTSALGSLLLESPCEIIQLQEVWTDDHYESAKRAIMRSLPELSSTRADSTQKPYIGQSGLAIFTSDFLTDQSFEKFAINQAGIFDRVRGMLGVIKGIAYSKIHFRSDDTSLLHMMNLHTHPSSVPVRISQIVQLLETFERMLPLTAPVVITGDFNFEPDSVEYELLKNVSLLSDSYTENHGGYSSTVCTYCASNPQHWGGGSRVIDFVWLRSANVQKIKSVSSMINLQEFQGLVPSDHFGLRSNIELATEAPTVVSKVTHQERMVRAGRSVAKAIEILEGEDSDIYSDVVAKLRSYRVRFLTQELNDPMVQQLMIP